MKELHKTVTIKSGQIYNAEDGYRLIAIKPKELDKFNFARGFIRRYKGINNTLEEVSGHLHNISKSIRKGSFEYEGLGGKKGRMDVYRVRKTEFDILMDIALELVEDIKDNYKIFEKYKEF